MSNSQSQKAGDNAQQLQADKMIFNIGIDEKRAREIYQEMNIQVRRDYTQEALEIANSRVAEFENMLLPKMEAVDGALESFRDPSFQLLLVEAQKTAASTERPADYDLLSELLIHRFKKGENRIVRAGINRAVEIVDEISDEALLGLTVFHSVSYFFPVSGDINEGLNVLDNLYGKILYKDLPSGRDWLDHLDILDAVRINSIGRLKKINECYSEQLNGYVGVGIEKDSENCKKAIEILNENRLPQNILVEHTLNTGYLRVSIPNRNQIGSLSLRHRLPINGEIIIVNTPLTDGQINAIQSIFDLYTTDEVIKNRNIDALMKEWDKRKNLKLLRDWWDGIDASIQLTAVGRVLAHSNAQRCDKSLPSLD